MYQKFGCLIGLMLLAGCGEQPAPLEETQSTQQQVTPEKPEPSADAQGERQQKTEEKAAVPEKKVAVTEKKATVDETVSAQSLLEQLQSNDSTERIRALRKLEQADINGNEFVPVLSGLLDVENSRVADMARRILFSMTWKSRGLLVDFYADWCGPCRMMKPVVKELQKEGYPVIQVNVDENRELSRKYYITSIPTFAVIVDGKMQRQEVGVVPKSALLKLLKTIPEEKDTKGPSVTDPAMKIYGPLLAMSSANHLERYEAVQQLVAQRETTLPLLLQILRDSSQRSEFRQSAMKALAAFMKYAESAPQVLDVMTEIMNDSQESEPLQGAAVVFLSRFSPVRSSELDGRLVSLLKMSGPEDLQVAAAKEIGAHQISRGLPVLMKKLSYLKEASDKERRAYIEAIGEFGARAETVVPLLLSAYVKYPDDSEEIDYALNQICPESKQAAAALADALDNEHEELKQRALELLQHAEYLSAAAEPLQILLTDDDPELRLQAALLLHKIGGYDDEIIPELILALDNEEYKWETESALRSAARYSLPALVKMITDPKTSAPIKFRAASILINAYAKPDQAEQAALEKALKSSDQATQSAAAIALTSSDTKNAQVMPILLEGLQSDQADLRKACINAISHWRRASPGQDQTEISARLVKLLEDPDAEVQESASYALRLVDLSADDWKQLVGLLEKPGLQDYVLTVISERDTVPPEAVKPLAAILRHQYINEELFREVVFLLGQSGKPALESLAALLNDESLDQALRVAVSQAIGTIAIAEPSAIPVLKKLLDQDDPELQVMAAIGMADKVPYDESLVRLLITGLQNENWAIKRDAQQTLANVLSRHPEALEVLFTQLDQLPAAQQAEVFPIFSRMDLQYQKVRPRLLPLIQALAGDPEQKHQVESLLRYLVRHDQAGTDVASLLAEDDETLVLQTLVALNESAETVPQALVPQLKPLLDRTNPQIKLQAALGLLRTGATDETLLTIIGDALQGSDKELLYQAVNGLDLAESLDEKSVPLLMKLLQNRETRSVAITKLAGMGTAAEPAIPALIDLLDTLNFGRASAAALRELGKTAAPAIPALQAKLESRRSMTSAALALKEIEEDHQQTIDILARNLDHPDLKGTSCICLSYFADESPAAVEPLLLSALQGADSFDRGMVLRALGKLKTKAAVQQLIKVVQSDDEGSKPLALESLGNIGLEPERVVPVLIEALKSPNARVRFAAARALGRFGAASEPAIPELLQALDDEQLIRTAAADALGRIGAPAKAAIPRLEKMLADRQTLGAALEGLKQFGPLAQSVVPRLKSLEKQSSGYQLQRIKNTIEAIESPEEKP